MMEREKTANRAKSQFLATMSHEIRTPMNGVVGTANLLATTPLNDRQTQLVHNLVGSGQALLGIINDILDLSKIEAGHFELAMVEFDPRELIAEISDLFSERCTSAGIEFIYFVAEEVPHRLTGDPARLRQVLINLVGNAIKFTERGEILVELSLTDSAQQHATLHCSVIDTGIGIDPEQRAKIFEAFYQVDRSMTRLRGGTGLGLSIVKELVTLMGGDIGVESELGHGSRFWFSAQLDHSGDALAATRSPRALERPLRALVVDANAVSAEVISRYLTSWRINARICAAAAEAETALQDAEVSKRPFDVVIIDVKGLTGEGIKLAREIRIEQQGRRPEVILLMGLDGSVSDNSLESLGAFALLTKPARPTMLFDCLVSIASGSRENGIASFYVRKSGAKSKVAFDARILVVEDNAVNLDVAGGILKQMGCSVVTASNGRSAVQLFAQETFDLILMDCEMPIMDGFDATRHMRDIERVMRSRTPIVALTAHALAEVRERCLEAGMDDFLVKPYDELQIADILGRWLTPRTAIMSALESDIPGGEERPPSSPAVATRLDMVAVDRIRWISGDDGSSLLGQVISQFTAVSGPLLATMRAKSRDSDPQAVWRAAHSLKSSASAIGAGRVSQYCEEIEALARDSGILPTEAVIAALEGEVVAAIGELNRLVGAEQGAA
jgi:two-component system sensor histidine kinase/response regulator